MRAGAIRWVGLAFLVALLAVPLSGSTVRAAPPTLMILSPADGSTVASDTPVVVRFAVTDFVLAQPGRVGQVPASGEGYANVFLDDRYVRLVTQVEPFSLTLSSGVHTIRMQLVHHNGTPLSPDVTSSVSVTASRGPVGTVPRIEILSPVRGERTGHGTYVSYRIENFTLVEPRGQSNAPNEGRVQLLVQEHIAMDLVRYDPVLIVGLPEGEATITVRLVNNDGTPLTPDAFSTVSFHVVASSAVTLPLVFNGGMSLLLAFMLVVLVLRRRKASARDEKARGGEA